MLTQAAKTGLPTESYLYDDQGRRIQKTVGSTATNYLYNGPDILAEYSAWTTPNAQYTHGPDMDEPVSRITAATTQYYHQDGLGSVVAVTDSTSTTTGTERFDAYGNKLASSGTIPQYGYTGREPDNTGLVYYRARYYDPSVGRFTQRDPVGFQGGINLYTYAANNPVRFTDPTGRCIEDLCVGEAIALGSFLVDTAPVWGPPPVKAVSGFALGYGTAAATGVQSTQGRVAAGMVGALAFPGGSILTKGAGALAADAGLGTIGQATAAATTGGGVAYGAGFFGEGAGQLGDLSAGDRSSLDYSTMNKAGLAVTGAYMFSMEGLMTGMSGAGLLGDSAWSTIPELTTNAGTSALGIGFDNWMTGNESISSSTSAASSAWSSSSTGYQSLSNSTSFGSFSSFGSSGSSFGSSWDSSWSDPFSSWSSSSYSSWSDPFSSLSSYNYSSGGWSSGTMRWK